MTILQIWLDNELLRHILGAHFETLVTYYVVVLCCQVEHVFEALHVLEFVAPFWPSMWTH